MESFSTKVELSKSVALASSVLARRETGGQGEEWLKKEVKKGLQLFGNVVTSITFVVNQLSHGEVSLVLVFNLAC